MCTICITYGNRFKIHLIMRNTVFDELYNGH